MKRILTELFDLEEDEFTVKEVVTAGVSLFLSLGIVFLPLFI